MPRVKRGVSHVHRRRRLLEQTKGYRWGRKKSVRQARTAVLKAGVHAYRDRQKKKSDFRSLWIVRLNAAVRPYGLSYSHFIALAKKADVVVDRKVLSSLAADKPELFGAVMKQLLAK